MKNTVLKTGLGVIFLSAAIFFFRNYQKKTTPFTTAVKIAKDNTAGYQIYKDNKLIIEQLTVPGSAGSRGFENQEQAQKVADLVVRKLSAGMFPPTVTQTELDSLHINY